MALSPMMTHYLSVKEKFPDCIVFYRLGDFYEMFFEDAEKASRILELTLTGRDCGLDERAPMCGVPFHAADGYIARLVAAGEKVAICEQLSEPNKGGLVERDVIRVVTAGTITEEGLDEKKNNYILAVYPSENGFGISWADITTGDYFAKELLGRTLEQLLDEIVRISPSEILCPAFSYSTFSALPIVKRGVLPPFNAVSDAFFRSPSLENLLKKQFKVATLEAYGLNGKPEALAAAGGLLNYLLDTQKHALKNLTKIKCVEESEYMVLSAGAIHSLEILATQRDGKRYGSLLWLLDKTLTGMGARTLQSYLLSPLLDPVKINERLDAVSSLYASSALRGSIDELLKSVRDVGRLTGKISNGNLNPKDCVALGNSLALMPNLKFMLGGISAKLLQDLNNDIADFSECSELLSSAFDLSPEAEDVENPNKKTRFIKSGFNRELDELRALCDDSHQKLAEIETKEREKTGIKNLKVKYNRVFGYYIEVSNSFRELVPYYYQRRQTVANAERYVTDELKDLENRILNAQESSEELELEIYKKIKEYLAEQIPSLLIAASAIGVLDVLNSFAKVSRENGYVRPEVLSMSEPMELRGGRHPVVEKIAKEPFIPNDALLDENDNRMLIITGPNMAGKSTYMRQIALISILMQIGCFVPCDKARIPVVDKIFTRIGASDNLILDQSTFMVEMTEVASILEGATKNSLILLDEIGRGTSTYDGLSIAWAVVEEITNRIHAKTLFATHYHELSELEGKMEGVKNYKVTVKELGGSVVFLRKIMRGGANRSFGIEVAALAGIDARVTSRAKEVLSGLENRTSNVSASRESDEPKDSEIERILKDLDVNRLSPLQALSVLADLQEKAEKK